MATQTQLDTIPYRLIITRRRASEILVSAQPSGWSLPVLDVPAGGRFAAQLVAGVRQNYRLEAYCLWIQSHAVSPEDSSSERYAVMETASGDASSDMTWMSTAAAASKPILTPADQTAVRSSLEELHDHIAEPKAAPFARPGWIQELFGWIEDQRELLGLRLNGRFQQLNASPTFSLLRIETTGAAVWFKATGEPNKHELPVSIALDCAFPNYVPRILAVHRSWNGWLSEEAPGRALDDFLDARAWSDAAEALAELQILSISKANTLLESGARDLNLDRLTYQINPFLARMSELMGIQTKSPPRILTDSEIGILGDRLGAAFAELNECRLPMTLGHLDLNPGNIFVAPSRCCFLDWAEASVTHPFFTFEYFREHLRRRFPEARGVTDRIRAAYLHPWRSWFSSETLSRATTISPLLAVFAYAVAGEKWRSPEIFHNPAIAGYFRGLTRRAFREAVQLLARREPCPT